MDGKEGDVLVGGGDGAIPGFDLDGGAFEGGGAVLSDEFLQIGGGAAGVRLELSAKRLGVAKGAEGLGCWRGGGGAGWWLRGGLDLPDCLGGHCAGDGGCGQLDEFAPSD